MKFWEISLRYGSSTQLKAPAANVNGDSTPALVVLVNPSRSSSGTPPFDFLLSNASTSLLYYFETFPRVVRVSFDDFTT